MKQCSKCGSMNDAGNIFCKKCKGRIDRRHQVHDERVMHNVQTFSPSNPQSRTDPAHGQIIYEARPQGNWNEPYEVAPGHPKTASLRRELNILYAVLTVSALLVVGVWTYLKLTDGTESNRVAIALFNKADSHYKNKEYETALGLYQQMQKDYPDNVLSSVAEMKITNARKALEYQWAMENQIEMLIEQAEFAFEKGKMLTPARDNANFYISQVLSLQPANREASQLRANLVEFYRRKAEVAFHDNELDVAKEHYNNMLIIDLENQLAQQRLQTIDDVLEQERREDKLRKKEALLNRRAKALARKEAQKKREFENMTRNIARNEAETKKSAAIAKTSESENTNYEQSASRSLVTASVQSMVDNSPRHSATTAEIQYFPRKPGNLTLLENLENPPADLTAALILKVAGFEQGLSKKRNPLVIYVLGAPDVAESLRAGVGRQIGSAIVGKVLAGNNLPAEKPDILYVGNEVKSKVALIYSQAKKVLSVSSVPSVVRQGVSLGISVGSNRKPLILINRSASAIEGNHWNGNVNDIATLYN